LRISKNNARLLTVASVLAGLGTLAAVLGGPGTAATIAGPCTERSFAGQRVQHTNDLNLKPKYNSFPPTTGTHYYLPAKFNIYTFSIPQIAVVHNLEHGGVAVQYGRTVSRATVAKIRAWYLRDSNALLVAPLPALGGKIALTAWNAPPYRKIPPDPGRGYVATCTRFDADAFTDFVKRHRYKGGESGNFTKAQLARQQ
jgi:hypothetical protein